MSPTAYLGTLARQPQQSVVGEPIAMSYPCPSFYAFSSSILSSPPLRYGQQDAEKVRQLCSRIAPRNRET